MHGKEKELMLKVEEITCAGCAADMENILKEKEGVLDARVNYGEGTIYIRYDPFVTDRKKLYSAALALGFKSNIISG